MSYANGLEVEKAARVHSLTLQEGMNQHLRQLTQMIVEMKEEAKPTRGRNDSRSRDKSTSRTLRRGDSIRARKERNGERASRAEGAESGAGGEPSSRRQRIQLEGGDDRNMGAASVSSDSE